MTELEHLNRAPVRKADDTYLSNIFYLPLIAQKLRQLFLEILGPC